MDRELLAAHLGVQVFKIKKKYFELEMVHGLTLARRRAVHLDVVSPIRF